MSLYFLFLSSDLDECASESPVCDINAACLNTVGSFSCACNEGYIGDGMICRGIQILDHVSMMQHRYRYSLEHETSARTNLCYALHKTLLDTQVLDVVFIFVMKLKLSHDVGTSFRFFAAQIYLSLEGKITFETWVLVDRFTKSWYWTPFIKLIEVRSISSSLFFFLFNPPFYSIQPHNHHLFDTMALKMFST